MEEFFIGMFGKYTIWIIPVFAGLVCSFIIEAINQATPEKVKGKLITTITYIVMGVFLIFGFPNVVVGWFDKVLFAILNAAFASTFYYLGGKRIVEAIVNVTVGKLTKKAEQIKE